MTRRCVLASLGAVLFVACQQQPAPTQRGFDGQTFGTFYQVKYVGSVDVAMARAAVTQALAAFDLLFNTWRPDSEISRFNRHRSVEPFPCSSTFLAGVRSALRFAEQTGGAFDPTVGPILRLYGFGAGADRRGVAPTEQQLADALRQVGWQKLALDVRASTLRKGNPHLTLDLSAIAKGAGVDRVAEALLALGIDSFMVNIGGEVVCRGKKLGGEPWRLGIEDPTKAATAQSYVESVSLSDEAMATSGNYRQFKNLAGTRYHHILDPRTGRNAKSRVLSVSVVAPTCELADGLATALMVVGPSNVKPILDRVGIPTVRVLFLLRSAADGGLQRKAIGW